MASNSASLLGAVARRLERAIELSARSAEVRSRVTSKGLRETTASLADAERRTRFNDFLTADGAPPRSASTARPVPEFHPTPAELEMRFFQIVRQEYGIDLERHANKVQIVCSADGRLAVFKPVSGEVMGGRRSIPAIEGEFAIREVAAFRVDEMLGFGLVPPTAMVRGPGGELGSLQLFVESSPAQRIIAYPAHQQEQMAVLDYLIGNTDRHSGNYRTSLTGDVVAIDHGFAFPETPEETVSGFTYRYRERPLSPQLLEKIRALDPALLRSALQDAGLGEAAIVRTLGRLDDIRTEGMIPGVSRWEAGSD